MDKVEKAPDCLICTICRDLFHAPMMYLCGHTFCRSCIETMPKNSQTTCPMCRSKSPELVPNYSITSVLEGLYPTLYEKRKNDYSERIEMSTKIDDWLVSKRYIYMKFCVDGQIEKTPFSRMSSLISRLKSRGFILDEINYFFAKFLTTNRFRTNYHSCGDNIINLKYTTGQKLEKWLSKKKSNRRILRGLLVMLYKNFNNDNESFTQFAKKMGFSLNQMPPGIIKSIQKLPRWILNLNIHYMPEKLLQDFSSEVQKYEQWLQDQDFKNIEHFTAFPSEESILSPDISENDIESTSSSTST